MMRRENDSADPSMFRYLHNPDGVDVDNDLFGYLGHVRESQFLEAGHNDHRTVENDAASADAMIESLEDDRLPSAISDKPGGA